MKHIIYIVGLAMLGLAACNLKQGVENETTIEQEVLNKVATQNDPVLTVAPDENIAALGGYYDAKAIGTLAYEWGYALVRMEQAMREYISVPNPKPETSYRAPLNEIGWATVLPTADDKDMPTANNDTYYMSAVVDLTEPYILKTPDTDGRYFVVNVFDMYHKLTEYIGKRNTGTKELTVALIPPQWEGELPSSVDKVIHVKTQKTWLWGRIHVLEDEDVSNVHALQDQFHLETLSAYKGGVSKPSKALPEMPNYGLSEPLRFYHYLAFAIAQNEILKEDVSLVGQFERIGIKDGKFNEASLNEHQLRGLREAALEAPVAILASTYSSTFINNGWLMAMKLDDFGYDFSFRSLIAGPYLGGQGEKEAMYPARYTDSENVLLEGKNTYKIHFEEEPPVGSFWSLTLYDANNKLFYDNELDRYKFSRESKGLKMNKDGSFEVLVQHEKPANTDNWLPAPEGNFYLILRLYEPNEEVIALEYKLPQMHKVK